MCFGKKVSTNKIDLDDLALLGTVCPRKPFYTSLKLLTTPDYLD